MPPVGLPAPSKPDVEAVTRWIDTVVLRSAPRRDDPGRVLARRLNRVEYNNTVRDLLGIAFRPADEFPVDDSGYGFDNIADVLTVSPPCSSGEVPGPPQSPSRLAVFGDACPASLSSSHTNCRNAPTTSPLRTPPKPARATFLIQCAAT